ncbi:MAG: carboxypeptidase regulatory-like domain-containing protein [Vicinamibacterales bacterium]
MRLGVSLRACVMVPLALILLTASAWAQPASGVAGVVRDSSGGVLPGVTVEAASPALIEKVRTGITDDQGRYNIVGLVPGVYSVTFTLPGFNTFKREGIELAANFTATVNADLRVGGLEETITVSGQSPVVDVQNATPRNQITRETLDTVPTNRTLEAFAALTPGVTMAATAQDVGGSKGETYVQLQIHGTRALDNKTLLDGFETNDYSGRVFVPNPAAAGEVTVDLGNGMGEAPAHGVYVNFVPRDGGNKIVGTFFSTWTGDGFQSDPKLTDELVGRGLRQENLGKVAKIWDVNGGLGGPIVRDRLWFYHSDRSWGSENTVVNGYYNLTPTAWTYTPDLSRPARDDFNNFVTSNRLTYQATQKDKFTLSYDWEFRCDCHRSVRATLAPEATARREYYPKILGVTWNRPATNRLLFSAGTTSNFLRYAPLPQAETPLDTIGIVEQSTGLRYRAVGPNATALSAGYGEKYNFIQNSRFSVSYVTGSHNFKTGIQMRNGYKRFTSEGADIDYAFRNQRPVQLSIFAYPLTYSANMRIQAGLYAQDQWTMNRLTLNMGIRYDIQDSYIPEQSLPAGRFTPERRFDAVECVPCWHDISPRASAIYDLFGNGRTAVKVSFGRYMAENILNVADANNPLVRANPTTSRAWNDSNSNFEPDCDLMNPAANGECGAFTNQNFGRTVITTQYDEALLKGRRPYSWAGSAVFQHELAPGTAINIGYFRTSWNNFTVTDNLNFEPSDYSPYCITLPSDSRLPGGGGNQLCGLYDINPNKFGNTSNILVTDARNFGKQTEVYNGMDITMNARIRQGAFVQGGMSTGNTITDECFTVDSPQQQLFCRVAPPFMRPQFKFSGSYPLPWDLQMSAVFQSLPGIPIAASYVATTAEVARTLGRPLAGGTATVTIPNVIAPQTIFENRYSQLDVRFIRNFRLGGVRLQAMFDAYNLFNTTAILATNARLGPQWLSPTTVMDARILKVGAQLNF